MKYLRPIIYLLIFNSAVYAQASKSQNNLMPIPNNLEINGDGFFVLDNEFTISMSKYKSDRLAKYADKVYRRISEQSGLFFEQDYLSIENNPSSSILIIEVERSGKLDIDEDESYSLKIEADKIKITAESEYGAFHALETLHQLLEVKRGAYVFPLVTINDSPRFPWRGLMLDVSRHFMPVETVKRQIDLMSAVKLNVLHWHLSDDQGFRVEIESHPELYKKGSDGNYYSKAQIRDVVKYASDRGIRVIPEIDIPGHATAILTAMPQLASKDTTYTIERNAGIFLPVIDPTNPEVYVVFDNVFRELAELFPDKYIHIGGDENEGKNWESNKEIMEFFEAKGIHHPHDIQAYFNNKLYEILKKYNKEMMGWEEIQNEAIPKSALIHAWRGENEGLETGGSLSKAVKNGYKAILSNGFYIDLLLPASDHYKTEFVPKNSNLSKEEEAMILGGEATMWAELITPLTIDSRIWPRTAAIAEKFWSDKSKTKDVDNMYSRLDHVSIHLERLGSQHKRNQEVIIRNISNYGDYHAVKLLVDVCEPMKVYTRNPGGTMFKTYTPYTKFADACIVDAEGAKHFNRIVEEYVNTKSDNSKAALRTTFLTWKKNHKRIQKVIGYSPMLKEVEQKSAYLEELGKLGLLVLEQNKIDALDLKNALQNIDNIKLDEGGRTELAITDSMKKFLKNVN